MGPTHADFLFSLQLGTAIGVLAFLADLLQSLALAVARLFRASQEPECPKRARVSVGAVWVTTASLLCFVLFVALSVWCALHEVLPVPAWIAALAILIPGILLLELIFGAGQRGEAPQEVPAGT